MSLSSALQQFGSVANMDDIVESKLMFATPEGDGALARKREIQEFPCDAGVAAIFNPGDTTQITIASNGMVIDPSNTFLSFKLTLSGAKSTAAAALNVILPTGAAGLINQLDILSYGSTTIESLPDYNIFAALLDAYTLTKDWKKNYGGHEAMPPVGDEDSAYVPPSKDDGKVPPVPTYTLFPSSTAANSSGAFDGTAVAGTPSLSGRALAMAKYCQSLAVGRHVALPFRHSGLLGNSRYIPLNVLGTLRLQIRWERAEKVLQVVGFGSTYECPPVPIQGTAGGANGYTDGALAGLTAGTYTITDVKLVASVVQLSSSMQDAIDKSVAGGGLPIYFPTYARMRTSVEPNAAGSITQLLPKNAATALSVFSVFYTDPANTSGVYVAADDYKSGALCVGTAFQALANKFDFWQKGCRQWQYRFGTDLFPRFQVRTASTGYKVAIEAIPKLPWMDKVASCPRERYSWENEYACISQTPQTDQATMIAGGVAVIPNIQNPKLALDVEHYPNKFFMGVNLQSTPGIAMSGLSCTSGTQPQIEVVLSGADQIGMANAGNERCKLKSDLITFLWYQRVLQIFPGQNVMVKE